ncbi:TIGR00366 family protein [Fictibacillus barbaricus]|uniref:Short-chain fatty acid transporter n=1 Tax=Fictibacillus barbaricus TaxID=182136 RepID=A0ABS2ZA68_9BACL|nr:TIGR00366 family protein [Fictibacillus barbaricus]MBN3545078.1 short-chain fatty acid transporter [Fictibacillus barbaricus]GGB61923.1 short-chain fatty acids transporter [Fictibacillus barbaricus]
MRLSISERIAGWYSRYFPHDFIFAIILTLLAILSAYAFTASSLGEVLDAWFNGIPMLFTFAFQLMFTYAAALVLVDTPVVQRWIIKAANTIKSPMAAYMITGILGALTSFLGWYIGPVVTSIFARTVGKQIKGVDYPLLASIAYSSFTISLTGISGTIPLFVSTEGELNNQLFGGIIPLDQTTFSTINIISCFAIVAVTTLIYYFVAKNKKQVTSFQDLAIENEEVASSVEPEVGSVYHLKEKSFADKVNDFRPMILVIGLIGFIYLFYYFSKNGMAGLNLNTVAFIALVMGLLVQKDAVSYSKSFSKNLISTGSIGLQFPLYGGIASVLMVSGLAGKITDYIVSVSTEGTFPVLTFLVTGFINLFIPSAGSQFTATAPFFIPAAEALGVEMPRAVLAITYGDIWTNLVQPFWTLLYFPILAAGTRLQVRDFLGYCLPILLAVGVIWILALMFLPI